jgi:type II secretory pathway pseudopilin PulG
MRTSTCKRTTITGEAGFTLIETIVALSAAMLMLTAFTGFYLGQQHSLRRDQVEIASSQALRSALEQISRELRSAGLNPLGTAAPGFTRADVREVWFTLDADASGAVNATDPNEVRGFRQNGTQIESYDAATASWMALADFVAPVGAPPTPLFHYFRCDGSEVTALPAGAADLASIARIDLSLTVNGVGGMTLSRTETESVRVRNKVCP